jgi:tungstate transport system ATP-binding protein
MTTLLSMDGLSKHFDERALLHDATLRLDSGEGYVLTGANGTGKSTLMRILAGLEAADSGTIGFRGVQTLIAAYPEKWRREIVYVHQAPYLFHTTLLANIEYGLIRRGFEKSRRQALARQALQWAGLSEREHVPPHKLSGGEKQRAALARVKVLDPVLLLLDEPTSNLDGDARRQVLNLVTELLTESHTVLVASHDPELQRLAILNPLRIVAGRIVADH